MTSMEIKQKMFSVKRGDCCVATSTGAAATSTAVDCLPACLPDCQVRKYINKCNGFATKTTAQQYNNTTQRNTFEAGAYTKISNIYFIYLAPQPLGVAKLCIILISKALT